MSLFQKLFGHKMADFHVTVEGVWSKKGAFKQLKSDLKPDTQTLSFTVKLKRMYYIHSLVISLVCGMLFL